MDHTVLQIISDTLSLLAIVNPFANLPIFISLTEGLKPQTKKQIFNLTFVSGLSILLSFGILGNFIMKYIFHINIQELKIAGGLLLVIVGLLNIVIQKKKKNPTYNSDDDADAESIEQAIIPMAFPLLVGPGSMVSILFIKESSGFLSVIISSLVVFLVLWIMFKYEEFIEKFLGGIVLLILSRVMQLFIVAIGIKLILDGIKEVFNI